MIIVIKIEFLDISEIFNKCFVKKNDEFGPYDSCHFWSLFIESNINGENKGMILHEMKWMNQIEIEDSPVVL